MEIGPNGNRFGRFCGWRDSSLVCFLAGRQGCCLPGRLAEVPASGSTSTLGLKNHPPAQNRAYGSESNLGLKIQPRAQNPALGSKSIPGLTIRHWAENPPSGSESSLELKIQPPAQNPALGSKSILGFRIQPGAQNPASGSSSLGFETEQRARNPSLISTLQIRIHHQILTTTLIGPEPLTTELGVRAVCAYL